MQNILSNIVTVVTIIVTFGPLVIAGVKYIGTKTNSQEIITIAERAAIIVSAIDNLDIENHDKQAMAIRKLVNFANELSISLTVEQATDYVDDAVRVMHQSAYCRHSMGHMAITKYRCRYFRYLIIFIW